MLKNNIFLVFIVLVINTVSLLAAESISEQNASNENKIYIPKNADPVKQFAALELQKYLRLITAKKYVIKEFNTYDNLTKLAFYVGISPVKKMQDLLQSEESRYQIDGNNVFVYGNDKVNKTSDSLLATAINHNNQTGTLFAVYDFLFHELGVRWLWPGKDGVYYKKLDSFKLENKVYTWKPNYKFRLFRMTPFKKSFFVGRKIKMYQTVPKVFWPSEKELQQRFEMEGLWLRQMKLGMHEKPSYGHAFKNYWDEYGQKHPEWFAQDSFGQRGPALTNKMKSDRIKFCVSNSALQKEIIKNLLYIKPKNHYYNACVNDGKDFCSCSKCVALDANKSSKSLSDRYVFFWNALANGIKKHDPNAKLVVYAYQNLSAPPKINLLSENVLVGIVPNYFTSFNAIKSDLIQWREHGLNQYFLRPNDLNDDIGFPLGNEKYLFKRLKIYQNKNLIGIDYDRNYNYSNWEFNGLSQYILARAISEPSLSFKDIENEYFATFKGAKKEMQAYYAYWRKLFESRREKNLIMQNGFIKTPLYKNARKYYQEKDFIASIKYLGKALEKEKNTLITNRINRIILAHKHAYKMFLAMKYRKPKYLTELERFRVKNRNNLFVNWPILIHFEKHYKVY